MPRRLPKRIPSQGKTLSRSVGRLERLEHRRVLAALSVVFADSTIRESDGADATTVTIAHDSVPIGFDIAVELESDLTEIALPDTVTIPADSSSVTLPVAAVDDLRLDGTQSVVVTATHRSLDSGQGTIDVTDDEGLHVSFTDPSVAENAGTTVATVSRTNSGDDGPALTVSLSSDSPGIANVPAQVSIPAGPAVPNPAGSFAEDFEGEISPGWNATLLPDGDIETSTRIELVNSPVNTGSTALKFTVQEGDAVTNGDVTEGKDRAELERFSFGDEGSDGSSQWYSWSVFVPEDDPFVSTEDNFVILGQWHQSLDGISQEDLENGAGTPPISITYQAGAAGEAAMFLNYGLGLPKQLLKADVEKGTWIDWVVHVNWSRESDGFAEAWVNGEAMLTDDNLSTRLEGPNVVTENDRANSFKIGIYRGFALTQDMTVYYDSVSISDKPPGQNVSFDVTLADNNLLDGDQPVEITADAANFDAGSETLTVTDFEELTVEINETSISEQDGAAATMAMVTRGNSDIGAELVVNLSTSDTETITAPETVTIPANQMSAVFAIDAVDDNLFDGDRTAAVIASADGYVDGSATLDVIDYEPIRLTADGRVIILGTDDADTVTVTPVGDDIEVSMDNGLSLSEQTYLATDVLRVLFKGEDGNDFFENLTAIESLVLGDAGDDDLRGGSADDQLLGGPGNDSITGNEGADSLEGEEGDDSIFAGPGADRVFAGPGNDIVEGGADDDTLLGEDGNDILSGQEGNDRISGGAGDDEQFGGDGDDLLSGDDGSDLLDGGGGVDLLRGGEGNDDLRGGTDADELFGDAGFDTLDGGGGDDILNGGTEDDVLNGDSGLDDLNGDDGNDTLNGGAGDDQLDGGLGDDELNGGIDNDILIGGSGNDILRGGNGVDALVGNAGEDILRGEGGADSLDGGANADILLGGLSSDLLSAGIGNDILIGGDDIDELLGGNDEDLLIGSTTSYDDDDSALQSILAVWTSADTYEQRIATIEDPSFTHHLQSGDTVFDDLVVDTLSGQAQQDWFFAPGAIDTPTDKLPSEQVNTVAAALDALGRVRRQAAAAD